MRPEIERSDRPEARQNSSFGWRCHKKLKNDLLLKIQNSNNSGTKNSFSKKFSAHLPGQNGDLGLYVRPENLISPKSAKKPREISKNGSTNPKKNLLERRLVRLYFWAVLLQCMPKRDGWSEHAASLSSALKDFFRIFFQIFAYFPRLCCRPGGN